jgi:diguanylate cyclase (GGDEF)-like protein/PAS domain S-box-containing protein
MTKHLPTSTIQDNGLADPDRSRRFGHWLLFGVMAINLAIIVLGTASLFNSHRQVIQATELRSRNLAEAVNRTVSAEVEKINIAVSNVVDEVERHMQADGVRVEQINTFVRRQLERLPEVQGIRVTDAKGEMIAGTGTGNGVLANIAVREYFRAHRSDAELGLVIAKPVVGRIAKQWVIVFSRRYNAPNGSFAGVVLASLTVDTLRQLLSRFEMGAKGLMTIRAMDDLSLVVRHPEVVNGNALDIGSTAISEQLAGLARTGVTSATYYAVTPYDGVERTFSFARLDSAPFFAVAGLAEAEYLSPWRIERNITILFMATFVFMSTLGGVVLWRFFLHGRRFTERYRLIFESTQDLITVMRLSDGVILDVNQHYLNTLAYERNEIIGHTSLELGLWEDPRDRQKYIETLHRDLKCVNLETVFRKKNGQRVCGLISGAFVDIDEVKCVLSVMRDITERKIAEEKINVLAFFDQLTGLPNRTLLLDRLKQAMTASSRSGQYGALLLVDLDNFKTLNDTQGHDAGDLLLKQVAQRLTTTVRADDTVARLGGDEFVVVLTSLSTTMSDAATQTELIGEKIIAALNQIFFLGIISYHTTPSVGASLFIGQQTGFDSLLKQTDLAMYRAKKEGGNSLRFFDPEMEAVVMKRVALEKDLHEAILEKQFILHYQAQITGNQLTGAEVLVRWKHPQRGLVPPEEFIPLAEETGLILPLGHWVLETACNQLSAWADRPDMNQLTIAVNVSAHQFRQNDFVEQVLLVLKNTNANPQRLKLELTESMLVSNVDEVIEKMTTLKANGVTFALDDFGTGYSSLSYLKRLPLDQLKIDRSFVRDVLVDSNDASIAKTVIALAQNLGLSVIAEGVETAAQRDYLSSSGCLAYQGYFFSRPLPLEAFERFFH